MNFGRVFGRRGRRGRRQLCRSRLAEDEAAESGKNKRCARNLRISLEGSRAHEAYKRCLIIATQKNCPIAAPKTAGGQYEEFSRLAGTTPLSSSMIATAELVPTRSAPASRRSKTCC